MKKLLTVLCLLLFAKLGFSQIVISGYLPNPGGTDGNYEYVQLVATENINFATTPYTIVWLNNGTATTKGWVNGGSTSYSFVISSGTVNKGDVFYVGGDGKLISGSGSTDISSLNWLRTINTSTTGGDVFGAANSGGSLGNGTGNADAVGVFAGQLTTTDSTKKPIDCVFYGSGVGTAYVSSTQGYTVADNDLYSSSQGLMGEGTNTTIMLNPSSNGFVSLTGTYNTGTKTWTTARTSSSITLSLSSVAADIASAITLASANPTITVNTVGFTNDFGLTYPNTPSSGSNFIFSGSNLTDSVEVTVNAPFEIRVGINAYKSGTIKLAHNSGTLSTTVLDVRFNPTTTGVFTDTIFFTSNGANTEKVFVKGTSSNNPEISFQATSFNINEKGGSVTLQVNIANSNNNSTSVDVVVLGASSATAGSDFTFTSPQTITFPANSSDSIVIVVPIIDDNIVEGTEKIWFGLASANNGAVYGANDSVEVTVFDNDYRKVNIADIRGVDVNGVADSLGKLYEVTGVVYGRNLRTAGFQFTLIDQTGGIGTFGPSVNFGYTVAQGDSITVRGQLSQFRGLAQLDFVDTIIFHQSNQPLRTPRLVTTLDESTESNLVRMNGLTAKSGLWTSGNQYVYSNGGNDSFLVRIAPSSNNLIGKTIPTTFSLIGIGGQFDANSPFTEGYQLFPRDTNDVIVPVDSLSQFNLLTPANNNSTTIQGAATQTISMTWEPSQQAQGLIPPSYEVLIDLPTGNFSSPLATYNSNLGGTAAAYSWPYFQVINIMNTQGISVGQSLSLIWTVKAVTTNNANRFANSQFNITLLRDAMNSVRVVDNATLNVYPNPASNNVFVQASEAINTITITSLDGKVQSTQNAAGESQTQIATSNLQNGLYLINVETINGNYTQRLVIQK